MGSPQYSIVFSAPVAGTATAGSVGDVLIPDATSGLYVKATTARRGTRRSTGIALSAYATGGVTDIQQVGQVDAVTAGLGTGAASWVRVSAAGTLERAAVSGADDVVGWVEVDGTLHACFGFLTAAIVNGGGGGGGTVPTGTGLPHIVGGAQDAAASLIVDADVTSVGLAKLTGLGASVSAFLGVPSGANLGTALTSALPVTKGGTGLTALTIPASALLVGTTDVQTLSGKTIAAGSNTVTGLADANVAAGAAVAVSKLAAGTNTHVLTTTGGVAVWAAPAAGGGLGANVASGASFISIGPSAAATGALRFANTFTVVGRDAANTGDVMMLSGPDAVNRVALGDPATDFVRVTPNGGDGQVNVSGEFTFNVGSGQILYLRTGAVDRFRIEGTNLAMFGAGSFGAGSAVVFIANRTTAPTTNPVGGGILYTEAGALRYRGSSGTVTILGPA